MNIWDIENMYYWFVFFNMWLPFIVQMATPAIIFPFQVEMKKDEEDGRKKRPWFIFLELVHMNSDSGPIVRPYTTAVEGEECTFSFGKVGA